MPVGNQNLQSMEGRPMVHGPWSKNLSRFSFWMFVTQIRFLLHVHFGSLEAGKGKGFYNLPHDPRTIQSYPGVRFCGKHGSIDFRQATSSLSNAHGFPPLEMNEQMGSQPQELDMGKSWISIAVPTEMLDLYQGVLDQVALSRLLYDLASCGKHLECRWSIEASESHIPPGLASEVRAYRDPTYSSLPFFQWWKLAIPFSDHGGSFLWIVTDMRTIERSLKNLMAWWCIHMMAIKVSDATKMSLLALHIPCM